ncbi:RlpA-like double-psi beta-barrel-protein domain-containing protein-containing protein [Lanmaoa asiatica]|nr:RlpA-like double-psi beta-barrel-protein domain-containing protein-containing protein [Lanmaoa asiatica]
MAPLIHLLAIFAISTLILASPHVSRNVYNHAHRAIEIDPSAPPALPRRKRSLNRRCITNPSNSTTSTQPTSTVPINFAPLPSVPSSSSPPADTTSSPTTSYVPPPSTTSQAPTTSTPAPAQTSSSSSTSTSGEPSYMYGTQNGQGTYYSTGLGACGITNNDGQYIAAVSYLLFDSYVSVLFFSSRSIFSLFHSGYDGVNPNTNPVCGKQVTASYQGKQATVAITDRCTGCQITDLDFSPSAFNALADPSLGRINITWVWS